jgi:hypothetical protein
MSGYEKSDLTADARAHLLGAIRCGYAAHEALQCADPKQALIEIDKLIAIGLEVRKCLLNPTTEKKP